MVRDKKRRAERRDKPEPESVAEHPTKADNPQHKEDFNSLLNVAVRKPELDDQT